MQNKLNQIQSVFDRCFSNALLFTRPEGGLFESDVVRKDNTDWLAIAAGIDQTMAKELFARNPARMRRAEIPLRDKHSCELSFLFIMRPISEAAPSNSPLRLITPLSPNEDVPLVEIRQAFLKIDSIPTNGHGLINMRWEWDICDAQKAPMEKWLHSWNSLLGFNPAHPPSHFHVNTKDETGLGRDPRAIDSRSDLRLAIGPQNPLALVLSIAVWHRTLH